jgi:type IV fimbrial biogenesis protein FimT
MLSDPPGHTTMNTAPARRARCRGISMIEVLVTLTILGLLLVAVMPSIGSWMRNTEIRNAAESIQNGLAKARSEAVRRNEVITFSLLTHNAKRQLDGSCALSSSSGSWVASKDNPGGKCDAAVSDTATPFIVAKQSQGEGSPNVTVTVRQPNGADPCGADDIATSIAFNGYGRIASTPAWTTGPLRCIVVSSLTGSDFRPLNIVIGSGGTVRMCDPDPSVGANDPRRC